MKNFLIGLLLGWSAAYWYYARSDYVREIAWELWDRASASPSAPPKKDAALYNNGASPYPSRP